MSENITGWYYEKLVTTWEDENFLVIQESEIIVKVTTFVKKESGLLDKSINESKNNISKLASQIILVIFSLISTIFILFLKLIIALACIILATAKTLFYVISFVIVQIGIFMWKLTFLTASFLVVTFLKIMWILIDNAIIFLKFMWGLIDSLITKVKNVSVEYVLEKSLQKPK
jgi:hypothetical protein